MEGTGHAAPVASGYTDASELHYQHLLLCTSDISSAKIKGPVSILFGQVFCYHFHAGSRRKPALFMTGALEDTISAVFNDKVLEICLLSHL